MEQEASGMARQPEPTRGTEGVLTQVCIECGNEYYFDRTEPPQEMTCDKCGNVVFRSFFEVAPGNEIEQDFRDSTERDVTTEDPATDVTQGDLADLNNP